MLFPIPTLVTVGWMMVTLLVINLGEAEETCRKGDPECASIHHDKYSQEANVDKFEVL